MSRIERKYCLISTLVLPYLAGFFDIFIFIFAIELCMCW